ncbi:inositol polyphosphate-5-phosphatase A isoform X1 [Bradysia coprophila]|uniref:inositol polyphosphate-5-phosphatase A isoform X1 n=1 Tax=Bradysia coprophila TaxID=38358 RepID=UPI00187DCD6A|nr:inositol polyphosphate-5-phosphatase A isoform X1 [Bradysia coprophila]
MDNSPVSYMLVTANVGSVFEDPSRLLKTWISEFLIKVSFFKPQFIGLHLQEVGGKTYEKSMEYVQEFIKILCESTELQSYDRIRVYLDEDYTSAENFTALGNLYFIEKTLPSVKIWNFLTHEWDTVEGKSIHTGNIEAVATKEKAKFPQRFFPECKWSRKGFLRTRWEVKGTVIDLVNIHLFHDASNLAACEEFPSVYCKSRRRALVHTLERFHTDTVNGTAPYFVFGDFNFRCDTEGVVKKLTKDLSIHRTLNIKNDHTKLQYRDDVGSNILTIGKKEFLHTEHQTKFKESWLQQFDRELEPLKEILVEYPITFPPTYPYEEEPTMPQNYMSTRCPAWCDRILMDPIAKDLIVDENFSSKDYNVVGEDMCMGDHKPVYLNIRLKVYQGIIVCSCKHAKNHFSDASCIETTCLHSSADLNVLLECLKSKDSQNLNTFNLSHIDVVSVTPVSPLVSCNSKKPPPISINVTDTENDESVCMCAVFASSDNILAESNAMIGAICSKCRNIIKQQPTEHRKTLISKRLTLANDIIVNRVDTHFLSLNSYVSSKCEPYTPESIESHSPQPECLDYSENDYDDSVDIIGNVVEADDLPKMVPTMQQTIAPSQGVSPRQLKSRLESLTLNRTEKAFDRQTDRDLKVKKCFERCCCHIL